MNVLHKNWVLKEIEEEIDTVQAQLEDLRIKTKTVKDEREDLCNLLNPKKKRLSHLSLIAVTISERRNKTESSENDDSCYHESMVHIGLEIRDLKRKVDSLSLELDLKTKELTELGNQSSFLNGRRDRLHEAYCNL